MKLNKKQRENLAKIIADLGKLFIAIVVLGQWVSPAGFSLNKVLTGFFLSLLFFGLTLVIDKGGGQ